MNSDTNNDIQVINRKNRLKEKVIAASQGQSGGKGFIDPQAIKRAQAVIDDGHDEYKKELNNNLDELIECWASIKNEANEPSELKQERDNFHRLSNHIADIAGTYGYELMAYFGKSLRDFNDKFEASNIKHQTIVKAHIDVMMIAYQNDIKTAESDAAKELINVVSQAIDKHS